MAHNQTIPNDTENGAVLSPRQESVALGVASGLSLAAAARKAKVGVPTAKHWSATLPAFRRRVRDLRAEMTSQALGRLVDGMASAADTLGFLSRKGKSEMIRLSAARAVLELKQGAGDRGTGNQIGRAGKASDQQRRKAMAIANRLKRLEAAVAKNADWPNAGLLVMRWLFFTRDLLFSADAAVQENARRTLADMPPLAELLRQSHPEMSEKALRAEAVQLERLTRLTGKELMASAMGNAGSMVAASENDSDHTPESGACRE